MSGRNDYEIRYKAIQLHQGGIGFNDVLRRVRRAAFAGIGAETIHFELQRRGLRRLPAISRTASLSIPISMPVVTRRFLSPRAVCRSFAKWTPMVASSSTGPSISSAANWNVNTSWPHSRRIIAESSSGTKASSSNRSLSRFLDRSSSLFSEALHLDVLTVPSIKNHISMSVWLPLSHYSFSN